MHDLFAVNRLIYIVLFPSLQKVWRRSTPKILVVAALIIIFHTVLMTLLDVNLHWVYDRSTYLWRMTNTEWTEFYIKYFEVYWSTCEIIMIVSLDTITFSYIIYRKSKLYITNAHERRRIETRLLLQSFCQCTPTITVNIIFFFILPETKNKNLQIVFSSIWIVTNILDTSIILLFHFPNVIAN
ncbi:hypothetical protein PMAYCL1PPCAC_22141, partial [Pristionchus mayeri]